MRYAERGFGLLEVLIAGAIVTLAALAGLWTCKTIAALGAAGLRSGHDSVAIDAQANRLRADAAAAFAVFVPVSDMNGAANSGPDGAHEIDFYARADDGRPYFWRYFYDARAHTLQRFDYDSGGASGVRDVATGRIDPAAAYPALTAVTAFAAQSLTADRLGDAAANRYGGIGALFARPPQAYAVPFVQPGGGAAASGGNAIVQVTLANAAAARTVHLAAATLPGGFTVTGAPRWHAIVYRVDQTHRFGFGFAGKSHVFINARIDVSYDGWQTRQVWCDFNLLGNPDGLDPHDPHADYTPDERFEQAESILARCRTLHPTPPTRDSAGNQPELGTVTQPLPGPTPPACWTNPGPGGRCWPPDVPSDWSPPTPLPMEPPPASWCASHARSVACANAAGRS